MLGKELLVSLPSSGREPGPWASKHTSAYRFVQVYGVGASPSHPSSSSSLASTPLPVPIAMPRENHLIGQGRETWSTWLTWSSSLVLGSPWMLSKYLLTTVSLVPEPLHALLLSRLHKHRGVTEVEPRSASLGAVCLGWIRVIQCIRKE